MHDPVCHDLHAQAVCTVVATARCTVRKRQLSIVEELSHIYEVKTEELH